LSRPINNEFTYKTSDYDTKDSIDNKLNKFKSSIKQEEEKHNFAQKSKDYLTFQNTFTQNDIQNTKHEVEFRQYNLDKYENSNQRFMNTEGDLFKKPTTELGNRLGIMKSAAVHLIASKYDKSSTPQNPTSDTEFENSTSNLINASKQKLQNIDEMIKKSDYSKIDIKHDFNKYLNKEPKQLQHDHPADQQSTSDFRKTEKQEFYGTYNNIPRNEHNYKNNSEYNSDNYKKFELASDNSEGNNYNAPKQYTNCTLKQFSNNLENGRLE